RPDRLIEKDDPYKVVKFFRELGVTRVQIGIQHTDDCVLKYVNRNCTLAKNKEGIRILKQNGFKTDIHLMLDLPMPELETLYSQAEPEHYEIVDNLHKKYDLDLNTKNNVLRDLHMIYQVITDPDLQADQWKVYPTEITPYTKILEWYENGKYKPYAELHNGKILERVIIYLKTLIHTYIRINRVVRDIPPQSIYGGLSCPEMRSNILAEMKRMNLTCKCIRCREVKSISYDEEPYLFVKKYDSSGGVEYFISYENKNQTVLYGMIRLRINKDEGLANDILYGHALIRELHVYGVHSGIGDSENKDKTQHKGLGKKLIKVAEEYAYLEGCDDITVISGVGVKEYYRKIGFT
ncbi:GNAT family N-acetyltransferase, partial [bacterium]|nr:GNAT family N-acetyltransferase [Candidatus Elulimicrobium humile]